MKENMDVNTIKYCTQCGKANGVECRFCAYCGYPFAQNTILLQTDVLSKNNIDLEYYKANLAMQQEALKMQQEALELQRKELEEARRQSKQQEREMKMQQSHYDSMKKCPKCGSVSLSGNKKGYGIGKGLVGAAVFGPIGLVAGGIGSKKVIITCMDCGYKFKK